jgi:hypothetical protein
MTDIKRMDIKEFRAKGYLQEINRLLLHPLGLALEVIINDEDGSERLGGVWDYRDDPEGLAYLDEVASSPEFQQKAQYIAAQFHSRAQRRQEELGFIIQPHTGTTQFPIGYILNGKLDE